MSLIGKNIRKIRSVKKISQQAFAELFALTRANIGSYEEGRAEPKVQIVVDIANKFGVSVDRLLNAEISVNEISNFKTELASGGSVKLKSSVNNNAQIPYLSSIDQVMYLESADKESMVGKLASIQVIKSDGITVERAFEVHSTDMLCKQKGLFVSDIVFAKKSIPSEIASLKEGTIYVVLAQGQVFIRRMYFAQGSLEFHADNAFYTPVVFAIDEIVELWEVVGLLSFKGGALTRAES